MSSQQIHDLFVTDVDYDADEVQLGYVETFASNGSAAMSFRIHMHRDKSQTWKQFEGIKEHSIVRFTSEVDLTHTEFIGVRSVAHKDTWFDIDQPLLLDRAKNYRVQLVREWIPRPLKLMTRFQLVTACEVKAFAFTGLNAGHVKETDTDMPQHDFLGLEIKEIPGTIKSTNRYMQNMLAVLPTHMSAYHPSSWLDARDAMIYLPEGVAKTTFDSPLLAINSITPRLVDRKGQTVSAARFHLWIRLWADTF